MHNTMLFFTEKDVASGSKVYEIPEGTRSSKGRAIQNVMQIEPDDKVRAYISVRRLTDKEYVDSNYILMCTKQGIVKRPNWPNIRVPVKAVWRQSSSRRATNFSRPSSPPARAMFFGGARR